MARTIAKLPEGSRITDYISLGVIAKLFPIEKVNRALSVAGKESKRERDLPAHVVVYYAIAMALFMEVSCREVLRWLLEGMKWLMGPNAKIKVATRGGISLARERIGSEPMELLHDELVVPVAVNTRKQKTKGAFYRGWRLVTIDGSTLDVADTKENEKAFGRPTASRGESAYPKIRQVSLVENGTHVMFGSRIGPYATGEMTLAEEVMGFLKKGMLCLADRNFFSYNAWIKAKATGSELVWRVKKSMTLPCIERMSDGSYLSKIYPSEKARRHDKDGIVVRVIEYCLVGVDDAEPFYRLLTTILTHISHKLRDEIVESA